MVKRRLMTFAVLVVLVGGGAMDVRPVAGEAGAVLMGWLGGQGFGHAVADALFGRATPSGRRRAKLDLTGGCTIFPDRHEKPARRGLRHG